MSTSQACSVLEGATIVCHDGIEQRPLAFAAGRVSQPSPQAFRLDLREHAIFPGLINAHDHLHLNNVPPLEHREPFASSYAWIDAFDAHRQQSDVIAALKASSAARHWHGGLKNLVAGATTVAHHDPWHAILDEPTYPVGLLRDFGWSHSLGLGMPGSARPPRYGRPVRESFQDTPPTAPWIIHAAEGTDDEARGEIAALDALECLAGNTVVVHGVGMTERDANRVIECGAAVVWCPSSNLRLLGRTLDPRRLFDAGRLALGTDSRLTGSRDMLVELRVAAEQSSLTPRELLRMVTVDAAAVLCLRDRGALEPGFRGDCLIVRPNTDPYDMLTGTSRSTLRAVVRDGVPAIADPDFAEWFAHCGIETVTARLDGAPKLIARDLVPTQTAMLEPGLEIDRARHG